MKMASNDFSTADRQTKHDFTASTIAYLEKTGHHAPVAFYEENIYGDLVPFGSPDANPFARIDLYMQYGNWWYAIELKGRWKFNSTEPLLVVSGTYYNYEKEEPLKEAQEKGFIPLWAELYPDAVVRVWNVSHIKASELPSDEKTIQRYTCVPSSPRKRQKRALLPVSAATEYKRIKSLMI